MVGEIRDLETAEIAIKAAQTGHLVMSTLHTNDAPQTLTRLIDMGVKPYAIATSVSLIIAQRLARRLCSNCKQPLDVPAEALLKEGFTQEDVDAGLKIYGPKGCGNCTDGYKGRCGIYQVMPVTETIGRIIMEGGNAIDDQRPGQARAGLGSAPTAGLHKVKARPDQPRGSQQRDDRVGTPPLPARSPAQWHRLQPSPKTLPFSGRARTRRATGSPASPSRPTRQALRADLRRQGVVPTRIKKQSAAFRSGGEADARGHRHLLPPARDHADRRHPAGAGLRDRRQRPREAVDAEADPRHQGAGRERLDAARGASPSTRCTSTTCPSTSSRPASRPARSRRCSTRSRPTRKRPRRSRRRSRRRCSTRPRCSPSPSS